MRQPKSLIAVQYGRVLKQLRQQTKLSQEDFADRCQLHRTYIGAIERGEKNITLDTALRVATALEIPLSLMIQLVEKELVVNDDQS